ncbi:Tad domain-containing protein [Tardiphaga sp.]|uniref:TadE/TadG family type IV pilus assembly protein n=1 Tax=Tardiphaga sp. TaxID=1926292 RepID=UPI002613B8D1|nr:Tad domain-containing protein [Tardiphaga sp.]MDB5618562.1 hypothetical protein [Tardiphaga sp.]
MFRYLQKLVADGLKAQAGNVAVTFAIAAVPLLGFVGAAVDYSKANAVKAGLQTSLDSALLAAVNEPSATQVSRANSFFAGNYGLKVRETATSSFTQGADGSISGTATANVPSSFLRVFGITTIPATATGTAIAGVSAKSDVCILLINPLRTQALLVNSGAAISAPTCEVHVLSTQNPAAMFNATLGVKRICVKGSTVVKNGGVTPPVETTCDTISDPFAGKLPVVSSTTCSFSNQVYNPGVVTLNPGVYCGSTNFNGSGTLTLNPGLYVIKSGAMIFNSGWTVTGTDVTFYLVDQNATLTFNGNVSAKLSAPTSGTYANILMYEPTGLSNSNLPINGTSGSSFTGLMYLPSRDVTINSVSNMTTNSVSMVFSTLILNATNWSLKAGALVPQISTGVATVGRLSK